MVSCLFLLETPHFSAAEPATEPKTQNERESYSIGYQVGVSIKTDGVEVDFEKLVQGLQDAINEKEPRLSTEEMRKLIVDLKKKARDVQMRKIQEQIVANAAESEKFLEENGKKEGIQTTASGLQYKVLRKGDGAAPAAKDFVTVNYRGTFIDGQEFDNSYAKGKPIRVQADGVIKGWTEALSMMKTGAKWQLFVPPDLAYGRGGSGQRIPPNKVLVFEMELVGVEKGDKAAKPSSAQIAQTRTVGKMNLTITGRIVKGDQGYVIQGQKSRELFTVLNPNPSVLDALVASGESVTIEAVSVMGDNVDIQKIDGKPYKEADAAQAGAGQAPQAAAKPIIIAITGKIVKGDQGYIIRGKVPAELFTILNPNPDILDEIVKSGKTVTIEAVSVMGDNIDIQKIDGKPYKEPK